MVLRAIVPGKRSITIHTLVVHKCFHNLVQVRGLEPPRVSPLRSKRSAFAISPYLHNLEAREGVEPLIVRHTHLIRSQRHGTQAINLVLLDRLELSAFRLGGEHSIQLSYKSKNYFGLPPGDFLIAFCSFMNLAMSVRHVDS